MNLLTYSTTNIILLFLLIIGVYLLFFIPIYLKTKKLVKMLNVDNDVEGFLTEIDKEIDKTKNKKYMNYLMINKSAGLSALGKYKEAVNLLKLVDLKELPKLYIVQYYNNLLYCLLMSEKLDEAEGVFKSTESLLSDYLKQKSLKKAIKSTLATYEFYKGDISKSQKMFEELLFEEDLILYQSISINYFLALIYLQGNEKIKAKEKLEVVVKIGYKNIHIYKKATNFLKGL